MESIVTRSISGHLTERIQDHYSTENGNEHPLADGYLVGEEGRTSSSVDAPTTY